MADWRQTLLDEIQRCSADLLVDRLRLNEVRAETARLMAADDSHDWLIERTMYLVQAVDAGGARIIWCESQLAELARGDHEVDLALDRLPQSEAYRQGILKRIAREFPPPSKEDLRRDLLSRITRQMRRARI